MILLLTGPSHTGKTFLAQRILERYHYPYLSIDHLKMGLIRSGQTDLTPMDDDKLTDYLWPILREIIKTAIENRQNLVVEGCYIPFDWKKDFSADYIKNIQFYCLVMTESYIKGNFDSIRSYGNVIEFRLDDSDLTMERVLKENAGYLELCRRYGCDMILIDEEYHPERILQNKLDRDQNITIINREGK